MRATPARADCRWCSRKSGATSDSAATYRTRLMRRLQLFFYGNGNLAGLALALLGPVLLFAGVIGAGWGWITLGDRKSTRLNSSHQIISYAVFCLKKKRCVTTSHRAISVLQQLLDLDVHGTLLISRNVMCVCGKRLVTTCDRWRLRRLIVVQLIPLF